MKTLLLPISLVGTIVLAFSGAVDSNVDSVLDKALDFGLTGLLLWFGSKHLVESLNGVVSKIGVLRESVNELRVEVSRLEVMIENLSDSRFTRSRFVKGKDDEAIH